MADNPPERLKIKRFSSSSYDDEEESTYVEITRRDLNRLKILEVLYAEDVGIFIDKLPKEIIDGIKNYDKTMGDTVIWINLTDKIRMGFKRHGLRVAPKFNILIGEKDIPKGCRIIEPGWVSTYHADYWDEETMDLDGNVDWERIAEEFPDLNPEGSVADGTVLMYRMIMKDPKDFFERCRKGVTTRRRRQPADRLNFKHVDMNDFFKEDYWRGRICVTNIPTRGWARLIWKMSLERYYSIPVRTWRRYKKRIYKRAPGHYQVRLFSPRLAKGDEKVHRLMFYYIEKIGIALKFHDRKTSSLRYEHKQRFKIGKAMHQVYSYIEEYGEDSDEEISCWLEDAKKW